MIIKPTVTDLLKIFNNRFELVIVTSKRARQIVELLRMDLEKGIKVSVSIGIAVFPRDGRTIAELYEKADIALYRTKAAGKDSYSFYERGI